MRSRRKEKSKIFEETSDVDFGYEVPGVARYRANFFQQKYGISAVFRLIPATVLTVEELGLPPVLKKFPMLKKGLVLVTGPTGSGKSTTLAAMMDYANLHRQDHIITVEDPIEFVHRSQNCLVQHREVGLHTRSFRGRSARRVARRSGHPARRRNARSRNDRAGADRRRHRSPRFWNPAYFERSQSGRSNHRRFPDPSTEPDPRHSGRIAQRRDRAKSFQDASTNRAASPPWRFWWSTWPSPTSSAKAKRTKSPGMIQVGKKKGQPAARRRDHGSLAQHAHQPGRGLRQGDRQEKIPPIPERAARGRFRRIIS